MQHWIETIENIIDRIGRLTSWLTLAMVLITFLVVVLRYIFDFGSIALQESIIYMHGIVFLLGASYTLKQNAHVRVDIINQKLSVKTRAYIELLGTLLLLFPSMLFIFVISWDYIANSWDVLEGSREAGGLPGVYLLKSLMLVMAALMMLQGIAMILSALKTISEEQESH